MRWLRSGGKTYEVTTHDTFLAYPDTTIEYVADNNNPFEYYWVGFNGIDAKLLLEQTDFCPQTPVISTKYSTELKDLLLQIYVNIIYVNRFLSDYPVILLQ